MVPGPGDCLVGAAEPGWGVGGGDHRGFLPAGGARGGLEVQRTTPTPTLCAPIMALNDQPAESKPVIRLRLLDLVRPGSAMSIGALPTLSDGALPRSLTQ